MSLPYVPGHIIDECRDLRRQGHSLASLANRIGIDPAELARLIGEPVVKPADYLWSVDRLDGVL